jgi:hypothetical protein
MASYIIYPNGMPMANPIMIPQMTNYAAYV